MGNLPKNILKIASLASLTLVIATAARADDTINVSLWDKGSKITLVTNMTVGEHGDMSAATMGVKLSKDTVKAGKITFKVANDAPETIHEMLVLPLKDGAVPIIDEKEVKIAENTAGSLGEVPETDPGKTGALTVDLAHGKYLITCNIPGHYMNGMWSILTVE
jgi:uncharacterized cupredoxin-like copper-binding protein